MGVTVVVVLTYLSGILSIIAGIVLVLVARNAAAQAQVGAGSGVIRTLGILSLVLGIVTVLVAGGLRHGRRAARLVVTVVEAIQILAVIGQLSTGGSQVLPALGQIAVPVAVILLLWTGPAKGFFRR